MSNDIIMRPAAVADAAACADILAHYIRHTVVNMHGEPLPPEYFLQLIKKQKHFFIAEDTAQGDDAVCGYAYSDVWNNRCGYCGTVEVSVYVKAGRLGAGIGGQLMQTLLQALQQDGMRAAVAAITLPNPSSVRLHEKFDFVRAGVLPGVGWKFNTAYDVGFWVRNFV